MTTARYQVTLANGGRKVADLRWKVARFDAGVLVLMDLKADGLSTGPIQAFAPGEWREVKWLFGTSRKDAEAKEFQG
jgi:hypothetical protein